VIPPQTTYVFSVYGMDALDQKLEEICFRSEKAAELLGKQPEDQVTEEDLIKLACHEQGGQKGCPKQAEYIVVLNKVDTKELQERAYKIAKCLHENGIKNIFVTSYKL
jgi:probable selenium-dependent hydroxylase accessory protein YqeC